ncbi:serine protease [Rhodoferax koreense]|uniref:Serine protease n=1 Tax=Rhodoferax koreensis TaxID=1842727 RepID=A0A1P8K0C3_9BURK|nr:serine protease [Rhodoferax koreense]APW39454.1 serine protease [Rhodoferax koreense]
MRRQSFNWYLLACVLLSGLWASGTAWADMPGVIGMVKPSILLVGYFKSTNSPRFALRGTGFVVGAGNQAVTNAHVLIGPGEDNGGADLVVQVRTPKGEWETRKAAVLEVDRVHDLALLQVDGAPLPGLALRDSDTVREGQAVAFMGFPIGGALGFSPVTHRGMVSSITAISLPAANGQQLTERVIRSLREGTFNIFQLDGTAYPGNSGGPMFDADTGEVLGVINMVFVKGTKESALTNPSGITYAIPANFIRQLMQGRKVN